MKCTECRKKIRGFVAYFRTKPYCSRCYDRVKWRSRYTTLEQVQEIARRNGKRRVARNNLAKEVNLNKNGT